jgi:peptidoglycan/xylan/chitin deacetylase (PgdA/CDA1 family)
MLRLAGFALALGLTAPALAAPGKLDEPVLRLPPSPAAPRVALTLDACDGQVDARILDLLIARNVPATIFASGKWIARNHEALAQLLARPDLFEVEDHGARHVPAVSIPTTVYGLRAAGSRKAVAWEVVVGAADLIAAGAPMPDWFRGATAEYDPAAEAEIAALGLRLAGFSVNGDGGATLSAAVARANFDAAPDGAVIIAHLNQPHRAAGAGVAEGIADLLDRGVRFVRLKDVWPAPGPAGGGAAARPG